MKQHRRRWQWILAWAAWCLPAAPAAAINIQFDFSYDTAGFFAAGSPARTSLEAAGDYFSSILTDTFSPITIPAPYHSTYPNSTGTVVWSWQRGFSNPRTGAFTTVDNGNIGADQYVVYAATRSMPGITAGAGSPGTTGWAQNITGTNQFTASDINQIDAIHDNFVDAVETRGETSGFARWGGSIAFDTSARTWHFDLTSSPTPGTTDLFSVAVHELAHALGFGEQSASVQTAWESWVSGPAFYGSFATSEYGGPVPLATGTPQDPDYSHWEPGTSSFVYGTSTPQEAAMDPDLTSGTRKLFTALDAAAMKDIGWSVVPPPPLYGDYNDNGFVDAADYTIWRKLLNQNVTMPNDATPGTVRNSDYTVWRTNFGKSALGGAAPAITMVPEPSSAVLLVISCVAIGVARRLRRGQ